MVVSTSLSPDPVDTLLRHCEERWRRSNPGCVCGASLDCFAIARNDDPGYSVIARSAGDEATQTACGANLDCFAIARNDDPGYSVIARSAGDEATQAVSAEQVWIASLSLAMTILMGSQ